MGEFKDHPSKKVIREQWCKSLIRFIHEKLKYKFLYLGLPGPQALDLLSWIDYIDQVIAFQCRDYPKPSSREQPKDRVVELEKKLSEFERQKKLSTFSVYDGYVEEVVLKGRDINGSPFSQNDIVTIYNLDFCNGITVPLPVTDDKGNIQNFYKSETIRKLLEFQRDISSQTRCKKFIMFLTIHSNFLWQEKKRFIAQTQDAKLKTYINSLNSLKGWHRNAKLLKAYLYQMVRNFFCNCEFTPEFLPTIYYRGVGRDTENWLMHFTIIGVLNKQISGIAPCFQDPNSFLCQKFLSVRNNKLDFFPIRGMQESDCLQNSVKAFENSECYKQLWITDKKAK
jgi:hypothetical protein